MTDNDFRSRATPVFGELLQDPETARLLALAMTHRSHNRHTNHNGERLEFLGDSVLETIVTNYLYSRYESVPEGGLTRIRTKIVCGRELAKLGNAVGLRSLITSARQVLSPSDVEDAFEAAVAAIFLGSGYAAAEAWVLSALETHLDFANIMRTEHEPRARLAELFTAHGWNVPVFEDLAAAPGMHKVCIRKPDGSVIGIRTADTRKAACAGAAEDALAYL